jgi:molybdate transport system ATP-binding protein
MVEKPFEWEITLENGLWWKDDKRIYEHEFEIPKYLSVNPKNIILLED